MITIKKNKKMKKVQLGDTVTVHYTGKLENGEIMAEITKKIGLNKFMIIGRYYEQQNARLENQHILEDLLEAFMGALYKDSDLEVCRNFFINLVEKEIIIPLEKKEISL